VHGDKHRRNWLSIRLTSRRNHTALACSALRAGAYGRLTTEGLSFRILGPFQVAGEEGTRQIAGAKQRALLSILLLHGGQAVTTDRLIDELWPGRPPTRPEKTLHVYVSQFRRVLGKGRPGGAGPDNVLELPRFVPQRAAAHLNPADAA
jgi:DNA-binding response OmpR family regulator